MSASAEQELLDAGAEVLDLVRLVRLGDDADDSPDDLVAAIEALSCDDARALLMIAVVMVAGAIHEAGGQA